MANNASLIDETEYCPPLDAGLYRSIVGDFDLSKQPTKVAEVRGILDGLKRNAEAEQQTEFDPSGASHPLDETSESVPGASRRGRGTGSGRGGAASDDLISTSEETGITDITDSVSSYSLANDTSGPNSSSSYPADYDPGIEDLPTGEKEEFLAQVCPEVKKFDIQYTLRKNGGNFRKTLDELLNRIWLREHSEVAPHKSIDGFFNEDDEGSPGPVGQRKGKKRTKKKSFQQHSQSYSQDRSSSSNSTSTHNSTQTSPELNPGIPARNIWATKAQDLNFLTTHAPNLSPSLASALYHQCGTSIRSTLLCLAKVDSTHWTKLDPQDSDVQLAVGTLMSIFETLKPQEAQTLALLTHPVAEHAMDLATTLLGGPNGSSDEEVRPVKIIPTYARPNLSDSTSPSTPKAPSLRAAANPNGLLASASSSFVLKNQRIAQASAAYRASRSQPLMGGAAAYYSAQSRAASAQARELTSLAADAYVASQAPPPGKSRKGVDLHGLSAADAVRVSMELIGQWWRDVSGDHLGEGGSHEGFRIVTGRGGHSEGGRAKVRPAVLAALRRGGWRVDEGAAAGTGVLVVVGRTRGSGSGSGL